MSAIGLHLKACFSFSRSLQWEDVACKNKSDYDEEPFLYRYIFEVEKALIIMLKKLLSREEFDDDNVGYDIDDGKDDVVRGLDIWRHNHMFF